jgi:hypothetical protein
VTGISQTLRPDLTALFKARARFNAYNRMALYGAGAAGYADYPLLANIEESS